MFSVKRIVKNLEKYKNSKVKSLDFLLSCTIIVSLLKIFRLFSKTLSQFKLKITITLQQARFLFLKIYILHTVLN